MHVDEPQEWELTVRGYGHECEDINRPEQMDLHRNMGFAMGKMLDQEQAYETAHGEKKAPMKMMSPCHAMVHPFHMHGSHFQITRVDHALDPDGLLYALGEWRDTIPLYRSKPQIRFTPRSHMVGRILTHCHFAAHSDNGMAQLVQVHKKRQRRQ
jgi:FtsP/CotA-like multicopper oxidase with cupredoxin domain